MLRFTGLIGFILILGACASGQQSQNQESPESNALFALGVSAYSSGQFPAALSYFKNAEAKMPDNASYEMHTGLALMSLELYPEAEKKLLSACAKIDEYPDCWNNLSAFYLKSNRPADALTYAKKASSTASYATPEVALSNQARALIELRRYPEALAELQRAERIGQSNCVIHLLKAKAYTRQRLYDQGLASAKRAESLCVSDSRSHFWVAYLYQKNQRTDLSLKKYNSMLESFRDEKTIYQTKEYLHQIDKRIPLKEPRI